MKILHILYELRFSGAELLLYSAANIMINEGDTVVVLATGKRVGEYARTLASAGYRIDHIPLRKSISYFIGLYHYIKRHKYDVVHCHVESVSFWHGLVFLAAGCKVVQTIHNEFLFEGRLRRVRGWQRRMLARLGVVHVACSDRVARNEHRRFGISPLTIDNWFDPRRIKQVSLERRLEARTNLDMDAQAFAIVSIGNYGEAKNHEAIIEAVRSLSPGLCVHYYHCGSGGDALAQKMTVGMNEKIFFRGAVANVGEYLVAVDAFVSPSFREGGPIALIEAAASGTVCVTTDVGLAEYFRAQPNVVFVNTDATSIASALARIAERPIATRLVDGRELSAYAALRFAPEVGACKYAELYRNLTGTSS